MSGGGPWSLVALLVPVVLVAGAVVRLYLGLGIVPSTSIAAAALAWPLSLFVRHLVRPRGWTALAAAAGLAAGAIAAWLLYNRGYYGAPSISGIPDAGNHARLVRDFLDRGPHVYGDFVGLYGVVAWFDSIPHGGIFIGFTAVFYATVVLLLALAVEVGLLDAFEGRSPRARRIAAWATVPVALAAGYGVVLVQLHYFHAEGFYPQIFGLLLAALVWQLDARMQDGAIKLTALAGAVALYRYTYGLNLPDLMLALAVALALERRPAWRWAGLVPVATVLLLVAYRAAMMIQPYYRNWGPFVPYDVGALAACELLLGAGMLALSGDRRRKVRLPAIFAVVNAAFLLLSRRPPAGEDYYYLKTAFQPTVLVVLASIGWALAAVADAVDARRRAPAISALIVFCAAIACGTYATRMWRDRFHDRVWAKPPARLLPLVDLKAQRLIDQVLRAEHKRFGGYLTSFYPLMNFMNAMNGFWNGGIDFYWNKTGPDASPGHCVFWESGPPAMRVEPGAPQEWRGKAWEQGGGARCTVYAPRWNPAGQRRMCWRCF